VHVRCLCVTRTRAALLDEAGRCLSLWCRRGDGGHCCVGGRAVDPVAVSEWPNNRASSAGERDVLESCAGVNVQCSVKLLEPVYRRKALLGCNRKMSMEIFSGGEGQRDGSSQTTTDDDHCVQCLCPGARLDCCCGIPLCCGLTTTLSSGSCGHHVILRKSSNINTRHIHIPYHCFCGDRAYGALNGVSGREECLMDG